MIFIVANKTALFYSCLFSHSRCTVTMQFVDKLIPVLIFYSISAPLTTTFQLFGSHKWAQTTYILWVKCKHQEHG
jgi:ABC-type multidrug transport system permease subunit